MKTKIVVLLFICMFLFAACGSVTPDPTTLATLPTVVLPTTTVFPTATETATVTPTPWSSPTPETLYGYPTHEAPILPTCDPRGDCLKLENNVERKDFTFHDLYVGKYVLRSWCNIDSRFTFLSPCAVTISSKDNEQIEIWGYPARIGEETGADLTGNGKSDIIIVDWGGGNCCVGVTVFEADDNLTKIMDVGSFRVGTFTDLNEDGSYEYIAPFRIWSQFCGDCQVRPSVVYEYQPGLGYVPATHKFKDVLSADIQEVLDTLIKFTEEHPDMKLHFSDPSWSENQSVDDEKYWEYARENWEYPLAVRSLYRLTAFYLLAGQQTDAREILNRYFSPDKASEYMLGIQKDLEYLVAPDA